MSGDGMSGDGVVVNEAIRAAWDSYRVLEKRTPAGERQEARQRVEAAVDAYGRAEVSRGTVFLVGVLTGYLIAEQAGGGTGHAGGTTGQVGSGASGGGTSGGGASGGGASGGGASGGGDRLDPLSDLIPAVIRRLPAFESADPAQVPMVTGVLMAAAMGMDTVAWRDRFGPIPPEEALVHGFVLWLLADLFDSLAGQPGVMDRMMRETFDSLAAEGS
ncbi:hypothetical protein ACIQPT_35485 [Streptomyces sp. NPDC091289]|uniref:hypothetical protein n=1 Tax=Streptomyces sp. NPDC091289 TaxID=3365989 RepID=UPI0037FE277E